MTQDLRSSIRSFHLATARPVHTPLVARVWMAFLSLVMSSTLIGGMLELFEMHAEDAVIARAAVTVHPVAAAIALSASRPAARG